MKILRLTLALAAARCAASTERLPDASTTERELIQLENEWCAADIARDSTFFLRVLAEEFTGVGSRGGQDTKRSYIDDLRDSEFALTACEDHDIMVRIYNDVAVVTGRAVTSGVRRGVGYANRHVLFTNTYVRRGGRWQIVASQATLAAPQQ